MNKKSAVVCLSGGLDSSVSLLWAKKEYENLISVFFNYKQKAVEQERKASKFFSDLVGAEFLEVDLSFLGEVSNSSLNSKEIKVPTGLDVDINDEQISEKTAQSVWVPNRNGLFVSVAASIAEAKNYDELVVGFNLEEAQTFPDNSTDFVEKTNEALSYSTKNKIKLVSPTIDLNKVEILKMGLDLELDPKKVWPCYKNVEEICRSCESCKRFLRATEELGVKL